MPNFQHIDDIVNDEREKPVIGFELKTLSKIILKKTCALSVYFITALLQVPPSRLLHNSQLLSRVQFAKTRSSNWALHPRNVRPSKILNFIKNIHLIKNQRGQYIKIPIKQNINKTYWDDDSPTMRE